MITIDLSDKKAIVTGGNSGIGKAVSLRLAQAGCDLAINYHTDEDSVYRLKDKIESYMGQKAVLIKSDIRDEGTVKKMVSRIVRELGTIDILINNAGITSSPGIEDIDLSEWETVIDVNLSSAFYCAKHCSEVMKEKRCGKMINISSAGPITGKYKGIHCAAANGGLDAMTRALSRELADYNIRVNGIAPAVVETDTYPNSYPERQKRDKILQNIPIGRLGTTEDIANICVFLCSDLADHLNGQTIIADGGMSLQG